MKHMHFSAQAGSHFFREKRVCFFAAATGPEAGEEEYIPKEGDNLFKRIKHLPDADFAALQAEVTEYLKEKDGDEKTQKLLGMWEKSIDAVAKADPSFEEKDDKQKEEFKTKLRQQFIKTPAGLINQLKANFISARLSNKAPRPLPRPRMPGVKIPDFAPEKEVNEAKGLFDQRREILVKLAQSYMHQKQDNDMERRLRQPHVPYSIKYPQKHEERMKLNADLKQVQAQLAIALGPDWKKKIPEAEHINVLEATNMVYSRAGLNRFKTETHRNGDRFAGHPGSGNHVVLGGGGAFFSGSPDEESVDDLMARVDANVAANSARRLISHNNVFRQHYGSVMRDADLLREKPINLRPYVALPNTLPPAIRYAANQKHAANMKAFNAESAEKKKIYWSELNKNMPTDSSGKRIDASKMQWYPGLDDANKIKVFIHPETKQAWAALINDTAGNPNAIMESDFMKLDDILDLKKNATITDGYLKARGFSAAERKMWAEFQKKQVSRVVANKKGGTRNSLMIEELVTPEICQFVEKFAFASSISDILQKDVLTDDQKLAELTQCVNERPAQFLSPEAKQEVLEKMLGNRKYAIDGLDQFVADPLTSGFTLAKID